MSSAWNSPPHSGASVLEVAQQSQVDGQADDEQCAAEGFGAGLFHDACQDEVAQGDYAQEHEVGAAALVVEVVGEEDDEEQTQRGCLPQAQIDEAESQEEKQEESATEYHRLLCVVGQHVAQAVQVNLPHSR